VDGGGRIDAFEEEDTDRNNQQHRKADNHRCERFKGAARYPFSIFAEPMVRTRELATGFREALRLGEETSWAGPSSIEASRCDWFFFFLHMMVLFSSGRKPLLGFVTEVVHPPAEALMVLFFNQEEGFFLLWLSARGDTSNYLVVNLTMIMMVMLGFASTFRFFFYFFDFFTFFVIVIVIVIVVSLGVLIMMFLLVVLIMMFVLVVMVHFVFFFIVMRIHSVMRILERAQFQMSTNQEGLRVARDNLLDLILALLQQSTQLGIGFGAF